MYLTILFRAVTRKIVLRSLLGKGSLAAGKERKENETGLHKETSRCFRKREETTAHRALLASKRALSSEDPRAVAECYNT